MTAAVIDRIQGCLLGLAVGDAVGTTLEFKPPGSLTPIQDMVGGGPFGLNPGEWTDDTSMALCLASSLVEKRSFDPKDQIHRYCRWHEEGYMSSTGTCFDIGSTVSGALNSFRINGDPYAGSTDTYSAGNGSLMRLAPVPLFFRANPAEAIHYAGESSRTTHGAMTCVDACRYMAGLILGALNGESKETLLSPFYAPANASWDAHLLCDEIHKIAAGSFKEKDPPQIKGTGYVVHSLEAALWAFHRGKDFKEGCLLAANLGDDADTTAAIYGQLAGAHYGLNGIPDDWIQKIKDLELILKLANGLAAHGD